MMQFRKEFPDSKLIRVSPDQRVHVWAIVLEREWPGAHVGESEFMFSDDQIDELRRNGVDVEVLG
jgi:hypothetical protein